MIKEYSVESIIHCAVMLEKTPYQMTTVNVTGTANVLEAGRIFGLRRVTFISSETVYFGTKTDSYHEGLGLPVACDTGAGYPIGMIKRACEDICAFYAREYGLSVPIVRPGRIYGPGCVAGRLPLEAMIRNAVAHKLTDVPHIYQGSKHAWIYVKDCAKGIGLVHLAKALKYNIYNAGDGTLHTLSDFAQAIKDVIPDAEIRLGGTKSDRDIDRPPLDIGRIKAEGFVPDYDLKQGIRDYIDWVREGTY
jgi:nucleoside-diphosphate-sugar epimerase